MAHVNPIQIQKFLKGVDYPASKAALIENARSMGADESVCASLAQLPDEDYQTPADVSQAFGALPDEPRPGAAAKGKAARAPEKGREAGREAGQEREAGKAAHGQAHSEAVPVAGQVRHTGGNEFLIEAMQDSMAEIRICELALEKLDNADAKGFAQAMIDEHGRLGLELERLAADRELPVPGRIRPEQEMTVEELSTLQGRDFEQRWIQYNIDVHERDIKVFQHYRGEEYDQDIRAFARAGGHVFTKHLKMAHEVGRKLARA